MTTTTRPKRTMWTRRIGVAAALTAGLGLAVGVPATANADTPHCGKQAAAAAREQTRPQVDAVLAKHPDLKAELTKVRSLPKDQRKTELQHFRTDHKSELKELRQARNPRNQYRATCHVHHGTKK